MAKLTIIIMALLMSAIAGESQIFHDNSRQADTTALPVIKVIPQEFEAVADEQGFIVREVAIINRGVGNLRIEEIKASCKCSSGKMLSNDIYPMQEGKALLSINTDGLYGDAKSVEFTFISNAKNSPYNVVIEVADSLATMPDTGKK